MKLWAVEHICHHFWVGLLLHPCTQKWWKKCSTVQSFIRKEVTSYKIYKTIHVFFVFFKWSSFQKYENKSLPGFPKPGPRWFGPFKVRIYYANRKQDFMNIWLGVVKCTISVECATLGSNPRRYLLHTYTAL